MIRDGDKITCIDPSTGWLMHCKEYKCPPKGTYVVIDKGTHRIIQTPYPLGFPFVDWRWKRVDTIKEIKKGDCM